MFKRNLSILLIGSLIFSLAAAPSVLANSKTEKEAVVTAKVKAGIAKLGVGRDTRVEIKMRDKTKLKGYISEATSDTFSVTDLKTGATTVVAYPNVTQVKGNNLFDWRLDRHWGRRYDWSAVTHPFANVRELTEIASLL